MRFIKNSPFLYKGLLIFGICFLYFITARLGQILALQPGFATPIWPPSGIAIASILLLGPSIWPGIFLGSTIGNFLLFPYTGDELHIFFNLLSAIVIGLGAALQAWVGAYFIKKWIRSEDPLVDPESVVKFFIVAITSCLINSNIGSFSLAANGVIPWSNYFQTWITWFVGDTAGIFVFTPFILSWAFHSVVKRTFLHYFETFIICGFISLCIYIVLNYSPPLIFLIIPFLIWASFRLGYIGVSFIILYTMIMFLMGNSLWRGQFKTYSLNSALLIIETMIGVCTFMTWIIASNLNAREKASKQLQQYSQVLESRLQQGTTALSQELGHIQQLRDQLLSQERIAYLGEVSRGISLTIRDMIDWVKNLSQKNMESLEKLLMSKPPSDMVDSLVELTSYTESIVTLTKQVDKCLERIAVHTDKLSDNFEMTDVNALCEEYVTYAAKESITKAFWSDVRIIKDFDHTVGAIQMIPQEIGRVIYKLLDNSNFAVHEKKKMEGPGFEPTVWITTKNQDDTVAIVIRDNGVGISEENLNKIFIPFFSTKHPMQGLGLGLSSCFEIVVGKHKGELNVISQEGEFTEITAVLPRHLENLTAD